MTAAPGPQQPDEVCVCGHDWLSHDVYDDRGACAWGVDVGQWDGCMAWHPAAPFAQPVSLSQQRRHAVQDEEVVDRRECLCGVVAYDGAVVECPVHEPEPPHPCHQCGCMTGPAEATCWRCGAGQPDENDDDTTAQPDRDTEKARR